VADIAHQLAGQVYDLGEDPAGGDVARIWQTRVLPTKPGGVGRGIVDANVGRGSEKFLDPSGFV
jgi:hypothetical protein